MAKAKRNGEIVPKGMLQTFWESYCGQTSFSEWTGPLSSDHSLRIPTGTEVPRQRIITSAVGKMAHAVWTRSRAIF